MKITFEKRKVPGRASKEEFFENQKLKPEVTMSVLHEKSPGEKFVSRIVNWAIHPEKKLIYSFNEGGIEDVSILGRKGSDLCEMFRSGLPVPDGFIVSKDAFQDFDATEDSKTSISPKVIEECARAVHKMERKAGNKVFGWDKSGREKVLLQGDSIVREKPVFPLLLSIRASCAVPFAEGQMTSVLNVGINDEVTELLAAATHNHRFALDTYRRFLQNFGEVVLGIDGQVYENVLDGARTRRGVKDYNFSVAELQAIITEFKGIAEVPDDCWRQLCMTMEALYKSWASAELKLERERYGLNKSLGVAIVVQSMVYGNYNDLSGSGVFYTRSPITGVNGIQGHYIVNGEGEEAFDSITAKSIDTYMLKTSDAKTFESLVAIGTLLENRYKDMQRVEFTIENNDLWLLERFPGDRSAKASLKIAVEMVRDNMLSEREALLRIDSRQIEGFVNSKTECSGVVHEFSGVGSFYPPSLDLFECSNVVGMVAFSAEKVCELINQKHQAIYVCTCLCEEIANRKDMVDVIKSCAAVITMNPNTTSQCLKAAKELGVAAIVGWRAISFQALSTSAFEMDSTAASKWLVSPEDRSVIVNEGDMVALNKNMIRVSTCCSSAVCNINDPDLQTIIHWAERNKRMSVAANCRNTADVMNAGLMSTEVVGIYRTESLVTSKDRVDIFRRLILMPSGPDHQLCMDTLLTMLEQDFVELYKTCASIHVSSVLIKLLDMHINELFPDPTSRTYLSDLAAMASRIGGGVSVPLLRDAIENNSFQGLKGSGIAINFPFATELMSRAIIRAAYTADQEGVMISPVIMIPGVISELEVQMIAPLVHTVAANLNTEIPTKHDDIHYFIGCVLETPRSLLRAEFIANLSDINVIAFDTDKITEHMLGVASADSRQHFFNSNIFTKNQDPFQTLDFTGVGSLLSKAVNQITDITKTNRPQLVVTGRHVSDAKSCRFFEAIGVNYLSCEPSLVPIVKIEAAKAHIEEVIRHDKVLSSRVWGLLNQARIL